MTQEANTPWWLEPGAELCSVCGAHWHEEALIFCVSCDEPICAICIQERPDGSETICIACQHEPAGETS